MEGRDSVEVRLGGGAQDDALLRLVAAALPRELAADTALRVNIVSEVPAATRGPSDSPGTTPADAGTPAARRVRVVIRSTAGPCVGPEAATVGPQADLRALLARAAAEYRRCAAPRE